MTNISSYFVPVNTLDSGLQNALLAPATVEDMPEGWHFPWPEIWISAKPEKLCLVKLEFQGEVLGLVSYGIFNRFDEPDKPTFVFIENLETHPDYRGKAKDRLVKPIGKWLIWYCVNVGLQLCSANDTLLFLISESEAYGYYRNKIQMEFRYSTQLGEGKVYAFGFSRASAQEYTQRQEREWGTPGRIKPGTG